MDKHKMNPTNDFARLVNEAALDLLEPQDAELLQVRYGLFTGDPCLVSEIEYVYKIERKEFRKRISMIRARLRRNARMKSTVPGLSRSARKLWSMVNRYLGSNDAHLGGRIVQFAQDSYPHCRITWLHIELILVFYDFHEVGTVKYQIQAAAMKALKHKRQFAPPGFVPPGYPDPPDAPSGSAQDSLLVGVGLKAIAYWPTEIRRVPKSEYVLVESKRKVFSRFDKDGGSLSGAFESTKMGLSVEYESLLELKFLETLESSPDVVWYVAQPLALLYGIGNRLRNYYPDLQVFFKDGTSMLVEIKPLMEMACWENWQKWKALREHSEKNGIGYAITDNQTSFKELMTTSIADADIQRIALAVKSHGSVDWTTYIKSPILSSISRPILARVIIAKRMTFSVRPFMLSNEHVLH